LSDAYLFPIERAAWTFPLIALVLTLPYIVYSYRKFGSVSIWRTVVLFSFLFYLECACFLTVLPLPDPREAAQQAGPAHQLIPLYFVFDFIMRSPFDLAQTGTWLPALRSPYVLQSLFNFCLFLPFGIYMAYYFRQNLKKVLLFSFLLSLFFEITQLTSLFGLYPYPYRVFDADDLLLNTLGGVVGYFIYSRFLRFLPRRERMDQKSAEHSEKVGYLRRFAALCVDGIVAGAIVLIGNAALDLTEMEVEWTYVIMLSVYHTGAMLLWRGKTLGKAMVHIRVETKDLDGRFVPRMIARCLLRSGVLAEFLLMSRLLKTARPPYHAILLGFQFLIFMFLSADFLWRFRKEKRLFYERASGTQNVSVFQNRRTKAAPGCQAPADSVQETLHHNN
jgi:glycopeptide antibiotics resistance protein/uncharacterized RDD family membrane protein YckC